MRSHSWNKNIFNTTCYLALFAVATLFAACGDDDDDGAAGSGGTAGGDSDAAASDAATNDAAANDAAGIVNLEVAFDQQGCTSPSLTAGENQTVTIEHDGQQRQYLLYVPSSVDPEKPSPLILDWHGWIACAGTQRSLSNGDAIAYQRRTIVAFPEGLPDSGGLQVFNGGVCCIDLTDLTPPPDDVGFGRAIVADVASKICVDKQRVYSTGHSNGGSMSEYNACQAADLYSAVAPVSALSELQTDCNPSRPVSFISFNGTDDPLASYEMSQKSVAEWVKRDGCTGEPEREMYNASYCDTWSNCDEGVVVKACTVTGMGHCWPGRPNEFIGCATGGLTDIDANQMMYDFFEKTSATVEPEPLEPETVTPEFTTVMDALSSIDDCGAFYEEQFQPPSPDNYLEACTACLCENCLQETNACLTEPGCVDIVSCAADTGDKLDTYCRANKKCKAVIDGVLGGAGGTAKAKAFAWANCRAANCAESCALNE
jgi:polyhydroxybutyrate depolymerase